MKFIVENWFVIVAIAAVGGSSVQKLIANEAGEGSE